MQTNYLLPNKYKAFGWVLLVIGLIGGILMYSQLIDGELLNMKVFSIYNGESIFGNDQGFFKVIENGVLDEIVALFIMIGGLMVGFSREKVEDEFIYKLRKDSLVWAIIFNYFILIFAVLFIYSFAFFDVLVFNMFTPLLFFIVRFNFLKHKSDSHEE